LKLDHSDTRASRRNEKQLPKRTEWQLKDGILELGVCGVRVALPEADLLPMDAQTRLHPTSAASRPCATPRACCSHPDERGFAGRLRRREAQRSIIYLLQQPTAVGLLIPSALASQHLTWITTGCKGENWRISAQCAVCAPTYPGARPQLLQQYILSRSGMLLSEAGWRPETGHLRSSCLDSRLN
jgi:hypothetical protein